MVDLLIFSTENVRKPLLLCAYFDLSNINTNWTCWEDKRVARRILTIVYPGVCINKRLIM